MSEFHCQYGQYGKRSPYAKGECQDFGHENRGSPFYDPRAPCLNYHDAAQALTSSAPGSWALSGTVHNHKAGNGTSQHPGSRRRGGDSQASRVSTEGEPQRKRKVKVMIRPCVSVQEPPGKAVRSFW